MARRDRDQEKKRRRKKRLEKRQARHRSSESLEPPGQALEQNLEGPQVPPQCARACPLARRL